MFFSFFLFASLFTTYAQYNHSSNTAHISLKEAILLNNNIIRERTANFEKKAESKPLMFVAVKKNISALNNASNNLAAYIEELQKEVDSQRVLYELLQDDFYENILFKDPKELSEKGQKLKMFIDGLYHITKIVNIHKLTGLDDFANEHFNTKEVYYNIDEKKIDFFQHHFYDRTNYGIMMTMNYLLLDVKVFQLMYYRTVMSY